MDCSDLRHGGRAVPGFGIGWNPGWALPTDVDQLKVQLDADMGSLATAIASCTAFPADLQTTWGGFYAAWQALSGQIGSWPYTGILAAELSSLYNDMRKYKADLEGTWQPYVAKYCPGFVTPPPIVTPKDNPGPTDTTLDTLKAVGAIVTTIAITGLVSYVVYEGVKIASSYAKKS